MKWSANQLSVGISSRSWGLKPPLMRAHTRSAGKSGQSSKQFRLLLVVSLFNYRLMRITHPLLVLRLAVLLTGLAGLAAGCHSHPSTSSSRLASVIITNAPLAQVEMVTRSVFMEHGYQIAKAKPTALVFEKEGTGMNTLVYGDWSSKKVWLRVKVYLHELSAVQQVLLECDAFMVGEHGDIHFEEEHKLTRVHRGRFQDLLDEVSRRLK